MDLTRVTTDTTPRWEPFGEPVRYYDSLIWNEKFADHSEFELKTRAVSYTLEKLPLESVVTLVQSKELMVVEKHEIRPDSKGFQTLTVKGISLTSYIRHRVIGQKRGEKFKSFRHSNLASICRLLENAFKNGTTYDLTTQTPTANKRNPLDQIPDLVVTDSTGQLEDQVQGPLYQRWFAAGSVETPIMELLPEGPFGPYGLRMVRPPGHQAWVINVSSTGAFTRPFETYIPQAAMDVYKGTDRSRNQSDVPPVIFDTEIDDLILPGYDLSVVDYKTEAQIGLNSGMISAFNRQARPGDVAQDQKSGIHRRVTYIDGGDPEAGFDAQEWEEFNVNAAQDILSTMVRRTAVEGEVSPYSKIRFGQQYFLGDLVSVRGQYGAIAEARVTEYIRVEDEQGEKGYPALVYI